VTRAIAVFFAGFLVLAGGYVHGLWTDRWAQQAEPALAFARYEQLPMKIGDWQGEPIENRQGTANDAAGSMQRRYVHQRTGDAVTIALVCGRPGPVSIHTPDACYGASGFQVSTPTRAVGPHESELWTAEAVRTRASEETRLRIYWSWNAGAGWAAPENPRYVFAGEPVLHKLYLLREAVPSSDGDRAEDPCLTLLNVLAPALDRVLFPAVQ
jgi:hypothetical protein